MAYFFICFHIENEFKIKLWYFLNSERKKRRETNETCYHIWNI